MLKRLLVIVAALIVSTLIALLFSARLYLNVVVGGLKKGTGLVWYGWQPVMWHGWRPEMSSSYLALVFAIGFGLALPFVLSQVRSLASSPPFPARRWSLALAFPLAALLYYTGVAFAAAAVLPLVARDLFTLWNVPEAIQFKTYLGVAPLLLFLTGCICAAPSILIVLARRSD